MIRKKELKQRIEALEALVIKQNLSLTDAQEAADSAQAKAAAAAALAKDAFEAAQRAISALEQGAEDREEQQKEINAFYEGIRNIMNYGKTPKKEE